MKAVVDTSVLLRLLFGEPSPLAEWRRLQTGWVSRLALVEIARVVERRRLAGELDDESVARAHEEARRLLATMHVVPLSDAVLDRAASPMPTAVRTLDALHLATALEVARAVEPSVALATHDEQLARAARAWGLPVVGV